MGILASLMAVLLAVTFFVLPNSQIGSVAPNELMSRPQTSVVYQALLSGISEATTNGLYPDNNYLNYTSAAVSPLYGISGTVYSQIDADASPRLSQPIAMYQYFLVGAHTFHNSTATAVRATATDFEEKAYLVIKSTTCLNDNNVPVAGAISAYKVTPHALVCQTGTRPLSIGAVATIDMSSAPYQVENIQYYGNLNNMSLGHTVFIPGTGNGNNVNFDDVWEKFSTNSDLDKYSVDLLHVIFRTSDSNNTFNYTQTVAGLDTTATTVSTLSDVVLAYGGALHKSTVYQTLDTQGADHTSGNNSIIKIYNGNGDQMTNFRLYQLFGRGESLVISPTGEGFTEYVYDGTPRTSPDGVDLPTEDSVYVLYYNPSTLYDAYGKTDSSLVTKVFFRVGDSYQTTAGTAGCTNNAIFDIATTGSTYTGAASPCHNEIFNLNYNSDSNIVNAGTGNDTFNMDGTFNEVNGQDGYDTAVFGGIESYYTGGNGTDEFLVGYATDEPTLMVTDVKGDCSVLRFEIYDFRTPNFCSGCTTTTLDQLKTLLNQYSSLVATTYTGTSSSSTAYLYGSGTWTLGDQTNAQTDADAKAEEIKQAFSGYGVTTVTPLQSMYVTSDVENIVFTDSTVSFATACSTYSNPDLRNLPSIYDGITGTTNMGNGSTAVATGAISNRQYLGSPAGSSFTVRLQEGAINVLFVGGDGADAFDMNYNHTYTNVRYVGGGGSTDYIRMRPSSYYVTQTQFQEGTFYTLTDRFSPSNVTHIYTDVEHIFVNTSVFNQTALDNAYTNGTYITG